MSAFNSRQMRNLNLRRVCHLYPSIFLNRVSLRQDRSQPFLTVNEKEYNGYPRRISQIQQQRAVDFESLHKQIKDKAMI